MFQITVLGAVGLLLWLLIQVPSIFAFVKILRGSVQKNQQPEDFDNDAKLPKATVILCLRGADPSLTDCLTALVHQDYPEYEIKIIIDSKSDPAWFILEQFLSTNSSIDSISISVLSTFHTTCSLKCSALLQAVSELPQDCQIIALVDADTTPHKTWLKELVFPLLNSDVGATTGNRWFLPGNGSWGMLLRYLWNVAAVVQCYLYCIPWGGTLALKADLLKHGQLLERWKNALCEDVSLYSVLRSQGLKIQFVPSLLMLNRETVTLKQFMPWLRRQLLLAWLYHPSRTIILTSAVLTLLLLANAVISLFYTIQAQQWNSAGIIAAMLLLFFGSFALLTLYLDRQVWRILKLKVETPPETSFFTVFRLFAAMPVAFLLNNISFIATLFIQEIEWRGIIYQIKRTRSISLMHYQPFQAPYSADSNSVL